jgi:hypothetical protein
MGFVLADQPVLHARPDEERYGFASQLALGDADLIMMPIQRRLLACYTGQPLLNFTLKTKRGLRIVNAALCRNAVKEIACHRDDVREASYVMQHINQYPASGLRDGTLTQTRSRSDGIALGDDEPPYDLRKSAPCLLYDSAT